MHAATRTRGWIAAGLAGAVMALLFAGWKMDSEFGAPMTAENAPLDAAMVHPPLRERENRMVARWVVEGTRDAAAIEAAYAARGYDPAAVVAGTQAAPRLAFTDLPGDLAAIDDVPRRKRVFFATVLPAVLAVNEALRLDRARLERLAAHARPAAADRAWLVELAARYGAEPTPAALLERVDEIPVPLALAQAALESGWGRSDFAQAGNALFGEHTDIAANGMKPEGLPEGHPVYVERFAHPIDAVASYAFVLNSGRAYARLRAVRAAARRAGRPPDPLAMAGALESYSERGDDYVREVAAVIGANGLAALAEARFGPPGILVSRADPR